MSAGERLEARVSPMRIQAFAYRTLQIEAVNREFLDSLDQDGNIWPSIPAALGLARAVSTYKEVSEMLRNGQPFTLRYTFREGLPEPAGFNISTDPNPNAEFSEFADNYPRVAASLVMDMYRGVNLEPAALTPEGSRILRTLLCGGMVTFVAGNPGQRSRVRRMNNSLGS